MIVVVCGVAGSGKTTIGELLADELGWRFFDADDFHSPNNIEKMRSGTPLTDEDRQSWLATLRELIGKIDNGVVACSALKKEYRDRLRVSDSMKFVLLRGSFELVSRQLQKRRGHFFDPKLLRSQFADLEEPRDATDGILIELGRSPNELVDEIRTRLGL